MIDEISLDIEVIDQIAQGVFQTMLDIELMPGEPANCDECILATIHIAGAWSGSVSLAFSTDMAKNAASRMLKLPAASVTSTDELEVAAELANMIGGNLKSLLPSPSQLSLPTVETAIRPTANQAAAFTASLTCLEGCLQVQIVSQPSTLP